MPRDATSRILVLAAAAGLVCTPALAAAAATAEDTGVLHWVGELSFASVLGSILSLISLPLVIGFLLGLASAELGRMAWNASQGVWKATFAFSSTAAQYGAMAAVLACVLYFA